jgi:predicted PurR-regulated permease PerM
VNWCERRRVPRTLGTLLVMAVMFLVIFALALVLWPLVHSESTQLFKRLPELAALFYAQVGPFLSDKLGIEFEFDLASVRQMVTEHLAGVQDLPVKLLAGIRAGGTMILGIIINLMLIPVVMFYLLRDWNRLVERVGELMPRRWLPKVRTVAREIDAVLAEFVRGQLSVMVVLAIYYSVGLSIVGLQFAIPIGVLTGLLVFIPYVGFGLGLILGVISAVLQWHGLPGFVAVLAVYGVGQLLEGYVLVPWLVGDRIGLHPLAVIFALLAFGQLFGFAGVLFALPASAALLVGLRHLRAEYHDSELYR